MIVRRYGDGPGWRISPPWVTLALQGLRSAALAGYSRGGESSSGAPDRPALGAAAAVAVAVLAGGKTALTADQKKAKADGQPIELTDDQAAAIDAKRVQDVKKWLGWLLGWISSRSEPLQPWSAPF
jgi:hypothetical protein